MVPNQINMPSGRTIDPLRLRVSDIEIDDLAICLSRAQVVSMGIRLPVSLAQLGLARQELFVRLLARSGMDATADLQLQLLLQDAWQFAVTDARIDMRSIYDPAVLRQISMVRHHAKLKVAQRFGLEAIKPGKVKIMYEVADRLSCLEMQIRFGRMPVDQIDDDDALTYRDVAAGMDVFRECWSSEDVLPRFTASLSGILRRRRPLNAA